MSGWSIPIARVAEQMQADLQTAARRVTFQIMRSVVLLSPVDTGRFRANWNVSYGAPDFSVTAATTPARSMQEVARALELPVGGLVYLSNGLPYARRLEYGHSKQAPGGMVRVTVARYAIASAGGASS